MMNGVLLGLSGGVDSSIAAYLLKKEGYHVEGAYCIMSPLHLEGIDRARTVASDLGITLHEIDLREQFEKTVIDYFCSQYACGKTPSPCVICNPLVKFKSLIEKADDLGLDKVATGHYAKLIHAENGIIIGVSSDLSRDQSYMLYRLSQEQLSRLVFPLEGISKADVRTMAEQNGISSWDAPDSEENCFIADRDYADYIERRVGSIKKGDFILPDGRRIPHLGVHRYTVGQRKGLGISYAEPLYVKEITDEGDVLLCTSGGEYSDSIVINDIVTNPCFELSVGGEYGVKVRSAAKLVSGIIESVNEDSVTIGFPGCIRAAAPGQSAVLYKNGMVVCGGVIADVVAT